MLNTSASQKFLWDALGNEHHFRQIGKRVLFQQTEFTLSTFEFNECQAIALVFLHISNLPHGPP
ncbi:hypothetical protein HY57_17110 [Dyella japonica A8]|uniref:Uncharacterized protein n=1 Tax=Dyella japonica A8 TaxID=1217721 RepID=A0A075K578_9GAMM|nr:hypothetical protein HY57_17110 [Dyella japonica A8]